MSSSQASPSPANDGGQLIGLAIFFIIFTSIIVLLRFYARYLARAGFWWDDWILLVAYVSITGNQ